MTRVEKKVKSKGGFTILEVVIAMAIIAIVTATAASIMTSAQKSMARSQKSVLAANDIANITECFKYTVCESGNIDDFEDFEKAVEFAFGLASGGFTPTTDGDYKFIYELTRDGYVITVTVRTTETGTEKTVNSVAKDGDGKVIFELTYPQT
ncbi:MAG: type II secretion system GspH family protein [Clostridiales bacterium]|nr:type II secretion system GspH family protein [Clostridiales bacterium]